MQIALDVSSALRPELTGVAMHIRRLATALLEVAPPPEHRVTLVTRATRFRSFFAKPVLNDSRFYHKKMLEGWHPFWGRSQDVFHGLDARIPGPWMKAPLVATVHDIYSVAQQAQFAPEEFKAVKQKRYAEIVSHAAAIICLSQAVRRDVIEYLGAAPEKVKVIHAAGGDGFSPRPADEVAAVRKKYGLDRPYYLFVGSVNVRKNVPAMLRAFAKARELAKSDALFALAGRVGFGGDEIKAAAASNTAAHRFLGYVPDADIPTLYSGAEALIFTTLYEGFGIPAVEAFACGCPVIGANVGSLPEIIGDAGLLADPKSDDSIADALVQLMRDGDLRKRLAASGLARSKKFSWTKTAAATLELYRSLR